MIGLSTATWRYQRRTSATNVAVRERLQAHAAMRARFGYRRLHILLEREGLAVNHKRVHRIYRRPDSRCVADGGSASRERSASVAERQSAAASAGQWTSHRHAGRRPGFRTLNIVDDFTRECLAIEVDRSLPGLRVDARARSPARRAAACRRRSSVDNGPELRRATLDAWAYAHGVTLRFIRPGQADRERLRRKLQRQVSG